MGISRRQDRDGRNSRGRADPRTGGRAGYRGQASLPGAVHLRVPRLWRFSSLDAAFCLPPLGRRGQAPASCGPQMGKTQGLGAISHACGGLAAHPHAARSAMKNFVRNISGATAIEYGMIAGLIALMIITAVTTVGTTLSSTFYAAMAAAP